MQPSHSSILSNARLSDGDVVDLVVRDGVVESVTAPGILTDPTPIDLDGRLVLPAPAEPHAHLDKARLGGRFPYSGGDLATSIDQIRDAYSVTGSADILMRARQSAREALAHGCTAIRTHADCGDGIGVQAVRALLVLRAEFDGLIDLTVTALPNPQVTGPAGRVNRDALEASIALGVDAVGGCPALDDDPSAAIDLYLRIALEAGLGLDLHVDESIDPAANSLRLLALRVLDTGFPFRVNASHCVSLSTQTAADRDSTIELVSEAGIHIIACPQTNLLLQGRGDTPGPRGITPIALLQRHGVNVAAGGDNSRDPFNPLGRLDPLETASLLVAAAHLAPLDAYAAISSGARRAMGLPACGPAVGLRADLLAVPSTDVAELFATGTQDRIVIRGGRIVARSSIERWTAAGASSSTAT